VLQHNCSRAVPSERQLVAALYTVINPASPYSTKLHTAHTQVTKRGVAWGGGGENSHPPAQTPQAAVHRVDCVTTVKGSSQYHPVRWHTTRPLPAPHPPSARPLPAPPYLNNFAFRSGAVSDAVECYSVCLGLDPSQLAAYTNRAQAYLRLQQWDHAVTDCSSALAGMDDAAGACVVSAGRCRGCFLLSLCM